MRVRAGSWAVALALGCCGLAFADEDPGLVYRFDLSLDQDAETLRGEGTLRLRNDGPEPIQWIPLVLYPERFRVQDPSINDVNFDRFYVRWFDPGSLTLTRVEVGGQPARVIHPPTDPLPEGSVVHVRLPEPVAPGAWAEVSLGFLLDVPDRLGPFGVRGDRFVLEGGALPYVPSRGPDGKRNPRSPPQPARYDLDLQVAWEDPDEPGQVLLGDAPLEEQRGADGRVVLQSPSPLIAAGDDLVELRALGPVGDAPGARVFGEEGDDDRAQRLVAIARSVGAYARRRFFDPATPTPTITFVQAPLRDRFVEVTDRGVLYSDRLFHLFVLLQGFHELEAARATVQAMVRQALADAPLGRDRDWVCEGFAWVIVQEWLQTQGGLKGKDIRAGLRWLDIIPAVDKLLRAPTFTGADLYYGRIHEIWTDVPDGFPRALWRRQRGRIPLEKLRDRIGTPALLDLIRDSLAPGALATEAFRPRIEQALGQPADPFVSLWLQRPSPQENLRFGDVETLEDLPDGSKRVRIEVVRDGADAERVAKVGEPVAVASTDAEGEPVRAVWDGHGLDGHVELVYDGGLLTKFSIDPDGRVDEWRGDDERPRVAKLLINRLRVRVDLNRGNRNEGALGFTLIPGYDYHHAITGDVFYEQDERGGTLSYSYGFGWAIDQRSYGIGVGASLSLADLTTGVLRDQALAVETEGTLASVGAAVGFDTRLSRTKSAWGFGFKLGLDYSDKVFGTDFRYLALDASTSLTLSLWRGTQLGAELELGEIQGSDAPSQRLFDAGGSGTIRGVKTSIFVDTALVAVRTELRQMIFEDLDVPLVWFAWLRKVQVVAFLDTGDVAKRIDRVFVPQRDWKWGAGGGIRLFVDGLGVSQFVLRFDVATRLDGSDHEPQFYFGGGQSF